MSAVLAKVITEDGVEGMGRFYSCYRGIVTKNIDPANKLRLKVHVPEVNGINLWATCKGIYGSTNSGFKFLTPKIGDVVWVEFEHGDLSKPVWSYHGWAKDEIPEVLNDPNAIGFVTPNGTVVNYNTESEHLDMYIVGTTALYTTGQLDIFSEDLVRINAGNNEGVVNINELTSKLNNLVKELESLKQMVNTHTHVGVTTGGGISGPTSSPYNNTFSTFNKSDYEDTKFTH